MEKLVCCGAGVGKLFAIMELINNITKRTWGILHSQVLENEQEKETTYHEMIESGVIKLESNESKAALVYGQMNIALQLQEEGWL